jgi:uncharacterized protein (TIGR02145 family)
MNLKTTFLIACLSIVFLGCEKDDNSGNNNNTACGQFNQNLTYGEVSDIDGNTYKTIQIGTQTWMAENLKTTKYRNGESIAIMTDNSLWANNTTGAWCYYNNDAMNNSSYGKLYNWYAAANNNNICPNGWHIPTNEEWTTLTNTLGGETIAGGKMKSTCTDFWETPNIDATNISGFSGLPGGYRIANGEFYDIRNDAIFWSFTEVNNLNAFFRTLKFIDGNVSYRDNVSKRYGFSIRCVKD